MRSLDDWCRDVDCPSSPNFPPACDRVHGTTRYPSACGGLVFDVGGGAQTVWIWNKNGRQIDIQPLDMSSLPVRPDTAKFAAMMADSERSEGARVSEEDTSFAGHAWRHLQLSRAGKNEQDFFVLVHDDIMYGILVTQPTRDSALVAAAKKGFQLIARAR
jgi:hypothetical protein